MLIFDRSMETTSQLQESVLSSYVITKLTSRRSLSPFSRQGSATRPLPVLLVTARSERAPQFSDLPFSVYTSKFRIPQLLCLPLLCALCIPDVSAGRKQPGCGGILPILEPPMFPRSNDSIFRSVPHPSPSHCSLPTAHYLSNSFISNTYRPPRMCCKQRTYGIANLFRICTYEKHRSGVVIMVNQLLRQPRSFYPRSVPAFLRCSPASCSCFTSPPASGFSATQYFAPIV